MNWSNLERQGNLFCFSPYKNVLLFLWFLNESVFEDSDLIYTISKKF